MFDGKPRDSGPIHYNPETDKVSRCPAKKQCRLREKWGDEAPHFTSLSEGNDWVAQRAASTNDLIPGVAAHATDVGENLPSGFAAFGAERAYTVIAAVQELAERTHGNVREGLINFARIVQNYKSGSLPLGHEVISYEGVDGAEYQEARTLISDASDYLRDDVDVPSLSTTPMPHDYQPIPPPTVTYPTRESAIPAVLLANGDDIVVNDDIVPSYQEALDYIRDSTEEFMSYHVAEDGYFNPARKGDQLDIPGFTYLGVGSENSAYLHNGLVYKVMHERSYRWLGSASAIGDKHQELYANLRGNTLAEHGIHYTPTFFTNHITPSDERVTITVQPYLDPSRYHPAYLQWDHDQLAKEAGASDLIDNNIRFDSATGQYQLFDCLYERRGEDAFPDEYWWNE